MVASDASLCCKATVHTEYAVIVQPGHLKVLAIARADHDPTMPLTTSKKRTKRLHSPCPA